MGEKLNRLDRTQLYYLDRCVEMHREGIGKATSWKEALEFVQSKLRESGQTFAVTVGNLQGSCEVFGIRPAIPDFKLNHLRARENNQRLAALEGRVATLEAKLEETAQLCSMLAADAAALRGALVAVCQKTGIRPPASCGLVINDNGRVAASLATPR